MTNTMKSYIAIVAVILFASLSSCEDFIDLQPRDRISMSEYWKKSSDLENYVLQFYPVFYPYTETVSQQAGNSDNMIQGNPSPIMNGERAIRTGNWAGEWQNIRNINIFFKYYSNVRIASRAINISWEKPTSLGLGFILI